MVKGVWALRTTDRTSELRKKGYAGRRLGPVQMTTDTAVRVTRMVIEEQCKSPNSYSSRLISYLVYLKTLSSFFALVFLPFPSPYSPSRSLSPG